VMTSAKRTRRRIMGMPYGNWLECRSSGSCARPSRRGLHQYCFKGGSYLRRRMRYAYAAASFSDSGL
jgi:hypothetical protein